MSQCARASLLRWTVSDADARDFLVGLFGVSVPRSVQSLNDALLALPDGGDDDAMRAAWDHLAARLCPALTRFTDEPTAVFPAQRALLLMGGRPDAGPGPEAGAGLVDALRGLDLGPEGEGFSRLLESALDAGAAGSVPRLSPDDFEPTLVPLARTLAQSGHVFSAVDDLCHALEARADLPAAAVLTDALLDVVALHQPFPDGERHARGAAWLAHRGASHNLQTLWSLRGALAHITDDIVHVAAEHRISRALALWVLSSRLCEDAVDGKDPLQGDDRELLNALLKNGQLVPLEVLEAAELWVDLDS